MARTLALLLIACALTTGHTARATTLRPMPFEELVHDAASIVRAEVESVRSYEDHYQGNRLVRTEVVLAVKETLRGDAGRSTITLRHLGGEVGDFAMKVDAMPSFEPGAELVLFLQADGRYVCPVVGWGRGQYRVVRDADGTNPRVLRASGEPLRAVQQVSTPLAENHVQLATGDSLASAMPLSDFLQTVRSEIRVQEAANVR